jgi:hypothetical protein
MTGYLEVFMFCILCQQEFEEPLLFDHTDNICPTCYQAEIRDWYGYEGDCIY